ncbi:MAG: thioesterase family protein [Deinococcales bacterium]
MSEASPRRLTIELEVQDTDLDELGHVNNAHYLRYAEQAARAHSAARGFPLEAYIELGALPVVRRHEIRYRRPARPGDRLAVTTELRRLDSRRAVRHTDIRRADDGALLAEADTEWVWIDAERGRPVRVPQDVLDAFEAS